MEYEQLTGEIIRCVYKVHNTLGSGFLEKVYERALAIELEKAGFEVECQYPIPVFYDEKLVGDYYADLLVEDLSLSLLLMYSIDLKTMDLPNKDLMNIKYLQDKVKTIVEDKVTAPVEAVKVR